MKQHVQLFAIMQYTLYIVPFTILLNEFVIQNYLINIIQMLYKYCSI